MDKYPKQTNQRNITEVYTIHDGTKPLSEGYVPRPPAPPKTTQPSQGDNTNTPAPTPPQVEKKPK